MSRRVLLSVGAVLFMMLVAFTLLAWGASASDGLPEGVEIFQLPDQGLTCVVWPDGSGECYCDCETCFDEEVVSFTETPDIPDETSVPNASPTSENTPEPTTEPTVSPTDTPNPEPTETPVPEPTETDVPERTGCNRGIGNGSEDCDPGNSSGQGRGGGRRAGEDRDE